MQTRLSLKPGQNGTKKWLKEYGDKLVLVRYRYDEEKQKRYKTIEIIVEESDWHPEAKNQQKGRNLKDMLGIKIAPYEKELRAQVKLAGGIWRPRQQLWELSYLQIAILNLEDRIIEGVASVGE